MRRILLTGGTGFVGRNILPDLERHYEVYAPGRYELDIKDTLAVEHIIKSGGFDSVVLAGIPTQPQHKDSLEDDVLQSCLSSFMNFYRMRNSLRRIIYFGSGAEFDKQQDISGVTELAMLERFPKESYGFAKFMMNQLAVSSENVYNLRLFGCFGPTDAEHKFITHCIRCCMEDKPISIRQDCLFNYVYVGNLVSAITYCVEQRPEFHDYNACSSRNLYLTEIAEIVKQKMNSASEIIVQNSAMGKAYSASNQRLMRELPGFEQIDLEQGISLQIAAMPKSY